MIDLGVTRELESLKPTQGLQRLYAHLGMSLYILKSFWFLNNRFHKLPTAYMLSVFFYVNVHYIFLFNLTV